jgi:hypothetical protein
MLYPVGLTVCARNKIGWRIITQPKTAEIQTCAKCLSLTTQDNDSNATVICELGERRGDALEHGWIKCVHLVGPIQTDVTHTLFGRHQYSVVHSQALVN